MFTGIIKAIGTISEVSAKGTDKTFIIDAGKLDLSDTIAGDSICVSGVCLTVVEMTGNGFSTDVSNETLSCTTFAEFQPGDQVNLEKSLRLNDLLGGHLVSGHVDCVGILKNISEDSRSVRFEFTVPDTIAKYICRKGSVSVDGVSLTVNEIYGDTFSVNIIPHTLHETIFSTYKTGTRVNIEADLIARYLERLVNAPN